MKRSTQRLHRLHPSVAPLPTTGHLFGEACRCGSPKSDSAVVTCAASVSATYSMYSFFSIHYLYPAPSPLHTLSHSLPRCLCAEVCQHTMTTTTTTATAATTTTATTYCAAAAADGHDPGKPEGRQSANYRVKFTMGNAKCAGGHTATTAA